MHNTTLKLTTAIAAACAIAPATASAQGSITQQPQGVQTALEGNVMTGAFACAAASADAQSVNIRTCQMRTASGGVYENSLTFQTLAPAAATGWYFLRIPVQSFRVCMQTEVIWKTGRRELLPEVCR